MKTDSVSHIFSVSFNDVFLKAENVTFKKHNRIFISNSSFQAKRGELINIVGNNGCGKTTIMEGLCGITKPYRGNIYIKPLLKVAYMPQIINISNHIPVRTCEFISLQTKNSNPSLMERLGIDKIMNNQISDLSGGEVQKVVFYTTITKNADIILLDEPENHLDETSINIVIDTVKEILPNKAVVWISHDKENILKTSTHIFNIHDQSFYCVSHAKHTPEF